MKTKRVSRFMSVVLAVMMFIAFSAPFTQVASAASKKTFYVPTKVTNTYTFNGQTGKSKTTFKYNKNGLRTSVRFSSGNRTTYKRDKKGLIKSWKTTNKKGKVIASGRSKIEGGVVVSEKVYNVKGKKKTLNYTASYTYANGKVVREEDIYANGDKFITEYDNYGNIIKETYQLKIETMITTHNLKTDAQGNIISDVETVVDVFNGQKTTTVTTTNNVYTYDKKGNITKKVSTTTSGGKVTFSSTTTYKYKKVKVAKKFWNYFI